MSTLVGARSRELQIERPELPIAHRVRSDGHLIWPFANSRSGGSAAAIASRLIGTTEFDVLDPQAWLKPYPLPSQ